MRLTTISILAALVLSVSATPINTPDTSKDLTGQACTCDSFEVVSDKRSLKRGEKKGTKNGEQTGVSAGAESAAVEFGDYGEVEYPVVEPLNAEEDGTNFGGFRKRAEKKGATKSAAKGATFGAETGNDEDLAGNPPGCNCFCDDSEAAGFSDKRSLADHSQFLSSGFCQGTATDDD